MPVIFQTQLTNHLEYIVLSIYYESFNQINRQYLGHCSGEKKVQSILGRAWGAEERLPRPCASLLLFEHVAHFLHFTSIQFAQYEENNNKGWRRDYI